MTEAQGKGPIKKVSPAKPKMQIERPSLEFVRDVNRQSKVFTLVALAFCTLIYLGISHFYSGDALQTQSRFNSVFQILLIGAWTWFMFPYIRVTLQMLLWGMTVNERTADFFSKPTESPLVQYVEKRLSEQGNAQKSFIDKEILPVIQTWQRIGSKIEEQLPGFIEKCNSGIAEIREAARKIDQAVEKNEGLVNEARPAIEALKRIEAAVETEIKSGFLEEVRAATRAVRGLDGLPKTEQTAPSLSVALNSIRKNRA